MLSLNISESSSKTKECENSCFFKSHSTRILLAGALQSSAYNFARLYITGHHPRQGCIEQQQYHTPARFGLKVSAFSATCTERYFPK